MKKHPGFKAVQASIAKKQGISKKSAGAILASATRKGVLVAAAASLAPATPLFITASLLIVSDFVFAIWRCHRTGVAITSRKMSNIIPKLLLYNIAILLSFLVEVYVLDKSMPISKIAVGVIAMVEGKSIDESFKLLFGYSIYETMMKKIRRPEQSETKP
jgi:hypothetical protein